jgi:CRP-like cAMP-binding protein
MHAVKQIERQQTFWQALDQILRKPRTIPIPRWISPRHHTITLSEICGHSSFLLVAMSYAVDDFLTLRMVAVAGSTVMLFFTYWHPHGRVLWLPLKWNVLFIAINSYRISKIYLDRYRAEQLSPELMELRQKHVFLMDPVDFLHLVRVGNIVDYNKGDVVLSQGERNPHVFLVLRGTLKVSRDKKLTYLMNEGNFISESGLHVGLLLHGSVESCCSVEADSNARVLCWDRNKLVDLMEHDPSLRRSLKAVLSLDLIDKLKMQRSLLSMGLIDDPEEWTKRRTEQTQHRYAAILRNLLSHPGDLVQRRRELNKYRKIHHINEDFHNEVLLMAGWTPEEFAAGHKDGEHHWSKDDDAFKRDWKWYAKDVYFHIFG